VTVDAPHTADGGDEVLDHLDQRRRARAPWAFALPGATMGAMGTSALSRATGADEDEAARPRAQPAEPVSRIGIAP
jgi:hypothetical protein